MDIIRSRLCDSDYFSGVKYIHKMAKTRSKGDKLDIQPHRAKRKLFEEPLSHHEDGAQRTGETVHSMRLEIEGAPLDNKFTDVEVFQDPPHPYRTVTHSRCVVSTSHFSQRQSSPRAGQTHLQDFFRAKKPRLLPKEQPKTPVTTRHKKSECEPEEGEPSGGGV